MRVVHRLSLLALPLLVACEVLTAPVLPDGAQRFEPPPVYRRWWAMTQECSDRVGSFAAVEWYVVPGAQALTVDGKRVDGYWTSGGNTIVLSEPAVMDGALVRHEMLHSLSRAAGHPRDDFLSRCSGVVVCIQTCLRDAGPLPPASPAALRVAPDALEVGVSISPERPSPGLDGGYFTMTVTVRNPRNEAVVVALPPPTDAGPSVSFEYRLEYAGGSSQHNDRALDDAVTRFGPGEIKRQVYDFHVTGTYGFMGRDGLGPGTYRFRAAYGRNWAVSSPTVTLP